jgi:hypothetical protein
MAEGGAYSQLPKLTGEVKEPSYRAVLEWMQTGKGPLNNKVSNIGLRIAIMTAHEAGRSAAAEVRFRLVDVGRTDAPPDRGE